jgi:hypothetical protein
VAVCDRLGDECAVVTATFLPGQRPVDARGKESGHGVKILPPTTSVNRHDFEGTGHGRGGLSPVP